MDPTTKSVHRSAALTNVSIGYRNAMYIADQVFPNVPVKKQSDYYYTFAKGAWFRNEAARRAPGTRAARGGYRVSDTAYSCVEYAYAHPVPIETINNADAPIRPFETGVRFTTDKIQLAKEALVSTLITTAANWTTSDDVGSDWKVDATTNTFISDINDGKQTIRRLIGRFPNTLIIESKTFSHLKQVSGILDRIKYTGTSGRPADVTAATLAALFELDRVLIGGAIYSSAEEVVAGTDFMAVDLWETNATKGGAWLGYVAPDPALDMPSAGYVFGWKGGAGQESSELAGDQFRDVRYWWEDPEKQWVVETSENFDARATCADAGICYYDTIVT